MSPVRLETPRLLLRDILPDDEADIHDFSTDSEVVRFATWGPNELSDTRAYIAQCQLVRAHSPRDHFDFAVELREESRVIGTMRLTIVNPANSTADFGYTLNSRYWGRGFATEGARALLNFGFSTLNLWRMWASCDVRNHASYKIMEKLGMRREGHFRQDILQKGRWRDSYLYAILREEFHQLDQ